MQTQRETAAEAEARALRATTELKPDEMARLLQDTFSQRVAAHIAGVDDPKQVGRWARQQNAPRIDSESRMRAACQVFTFISNCENRHIARAWMLGMNPQLDDDSPIEAIAEGRFKEVMAAARSFQRGDL
ncbi:MULTISPECIES: XRE family transcriptional regulator [unclassified Streptomyces]|uniref:XRE family transcriptional regulator n=1 Tax=unclassified Streptomyces TaxID=2593676 RepID=UPI002DD7B0A9|nr:XRE family transcriptional regulator [Streptomyces sp. NBC_01445]WSE11515.1 XRE family transcriptional regulator [Streptomyces sp. NBC_01445]